MSKRFKFGAMLLALALIFAAVKLPAAAVRAEEATVVKGVLDDRVPFGHGSGNYGKKEEFGSALIEGVTPNRGDWQLSVAGTWGNRYTFDYAVDLDGFNIVLDLSRMNTDGSQIALIFGAKAGAYLNEENGGLGLKIISHNSVYGIVLSNQDHVRSIQTMEPAPAPLTWDSQNSGYSIETTDDILDISFKKVAPDYTLTVNENSYKVPVSELTAILGNDLENIYVSIGSVSDATEIVTVKKFEDRYGKAYDATVPAIREAILAYETATKGDLSSTDKIVEAEALRDATGYYNLRRHDQVYYSNIMSQSLARTEAARDSLAPSGKVQLYKGDVEKLVEMTDAASDNASLAAVEEFAAKVEQKDKQVLSSAGLSGDDLAKFNETNAAYEEAVVGIETARKRIVLAYVAEYESVAADITDVVEIRELGSYKDAINVNLQKLGSEDKAEIGLKLIEVQEKIDKLSTLEGWNKGAKALTYSDGKSFGYASTDGSGANNAPEDRSQGGMTFGTKVKGNSFSMDLALTSYDYSSWTVISITKLDNNFFHADRNDEEIEIMQSNPGLIIFIEARPGDKICVEILFMKATHTSYFSASRGQMVLDYKFGDPLNVTVSAKDDANSTYAYIDINGVRHTCTPIKNSEIKGALGSDLKGYLSLCGMGNGAIRVDKINGVDAVKFDGTGEVVTPGDSSGNTGSDSGSGSGSEPSDPPKKGCGSCKGGLGAEFGLVALAAAVMCKRKRA